MILVFFVTISRIRRHLLIPVRPMTTNQIASSANKVLIARNPKSGAKDQGSLVDELCLELENRGQAVEVMTDIAEIQQRVETLLDSEGEHGLRAVVAAGGDGTVSLLANKLPQKTPIAILPLGTENLLAKYLRLKAQPKKLAHYIAKGRTLTIDAGLANGKLFLVMLSCGFDAEVVYQLHSRRKGHINHWSYAAPIWNSIVNYPYPDIRIMDELGNQLEQGKWAFIFNVPRYAMNLPFVTDANPTDGNLDLLTFRSGKLIRGLFYLATVIVRQHRTWGTAKHRRLAKFRIESNDSLRYQLDGDPGGNLPVEVEIIPERVTLVVPDDWVYP